jgi:exopolyphosphatase/pppGpp-phosphohydrolase
VITRRTPIKRSPIRKHAPKRKAELVDVAYREHVRWLGCAISLFGTTEHAKAHECDSLITIHHIRSYGGPRDDRKILGLCNAGHLHDAGDHSIERGKTQFESWWGFEIEETAQRLRWKYESEV